MIKQEILNKLNIRDPYPYIKTLNLNQIDGPLWGGKADIFEKIILESSPKIIIELGSFLGNSTITMANSLKKHNIDGTIIAIDTWLGSQEHWLKNKCNLLHLHNNFEFGISSMYNQFCTNVICHGLENYIVPMPATTDTAFDILKEIKIFADVIYFDADHRENVIFNDLEKYSSILNTNGIIFGHDIDWPDVENAVTKYCKNTSKSYVALYDNIDNRKKFWRIQ